MNVGKSTKIALVKKDKSISWLAGQLQISERNASRVACSPAAMTNRVNELALIFDMKASDFIALGE